MTTRSWGVAITTFYMLIIVALSPSIVIFMVHVGETGWPTGIWDTVLDAYKNWVTWVWIVLLAGGPVALLIVRIDFSHLRLTPRRHILVSAIAAGLALALLVVSAFATG